MTKKPIDPKFSDVMTLEEFRDCIQVHALIDHDGHGHLGWEAEQDVDTIVYPSTFRYQEAKDKGYTHVIWFNR